MSTESTEVLSDPISKDVDRNRTVEMQNFNSKLWAYASAVANSTGEVDPKIVSHSDSAQPDPNRQWKLTLTDISAHCYSIQNVGTKNYAWVSESPKAGDDVVQKHDGITKGWTIVPHPGDKTRWQISPAEASDPLYWTQAKAGEGEPIQIMGYQGAESLWIFREIDTAI